VLYLNERRYEGRLLSIEEWLPFWDRMQQLQRAETKDLRAWVAFYREYLRAIFPQRRRPFWVRDPGARLLQQPFSIVEQAMLRFFILQARAMGVTEPTTPTPPSTSGTDSPNSTLDRVAAPSG
jgi:hypothetical protein